MGRISDFWITCTGYGSCCLSWAIPRGDLRSAGQGTKRYGVQHLILVETEILSRGTERDGAPPQALRYALALLRLSMTGGRMARMAVFLSGSPRNLKSTLVLPCFSGVLTGRVEVGIIPIKDLRCDGMHGFLDLASAEPS